VLRAFEVRHDQAAAAVLLAPGQLLDELLQHAGFCMGEMIRLAYGTLTASALSFPGLKAEACRAPGQQFGFAT
jgi:hypothetical protein